MSTSLRFLDRHWIELTRSPAATAALNRWATETPLLAAASCGELLDRIQTASVADADAILAQLAKRAPTDCTAAELLLQALRPGLGRLARQHHRTDRPDIGEDLAAIAWERIRTYPYDRRPGRIAANVLLDTLHRYRSMQRTDDRFTRLDHDIEQPAIEETEEPPSREVAAARLQLAVARQAISPETAQIVRRLHIELEPISVVAADLGVSADTLARRRRRALNALQTVPHPQESGAKRPSSGRPTAASSMIMAP